MFSASFRERVRRLAESAARGLGRTGVTPNLLTFFGFLVSAASAVLIAASAGPLGQWGARAGGLVLLVSGLFDVLDGALARATGRVSAYGAFWDSTLDRYSEGLLYMAAFVALGPGHPVYQAATLVALLGSLLVSYTRARAQSMGYSCDVGWLARPERVLLLAFALLTGLLGPMMVFLAAATQATAAQRVWHVWRQSRASGTPIAPEAQPRAARSEPPVRRQASAGRHSDV